MICSRRQLCFVILSQNQNRFRLFALTLKHRTSQHLAKNSIKVNAVVLLALMPRTRQSLVPKVVADNLLEVESLERDAERRALLDDRVPAEAALQHLVHQVLKELAVVPARRSPLLVVISALKVVQLEVWAADFLFHGLMFL